MAQTAQVVVEDAASHFDKPFTYLVPAHMRPLPGCRVTVPFGKANRPRFGLVMETGEEARPSGRLKQILSLVDETPLLDAEGLWLVRYLHECTFCGYYEAARAILPPGIGVQLRYAYMLEQDWEQRMQDARAQLSLQTPDSDEYRVVEYLRGRQRPVAEQTLCGAMGIAPSAPVLQRLCAEGVLLRTQQVRQKVLDEKQVMARLAPEITCAADIPVKLTPKQKAVVDLLERVGQGSVKEICYFSAVGKSVLDRLEKMGALYYYTREVYRSPFDAPVPSPAAPAALSDAQRQALESLETLLDAGEGRTALLYGVTGSGKTEVFMQLIRRVLARGRGVIVMVPEISLTPQTVRRFQENFGGDVAVLHSALTMGERADEWKRIRRGEARVVVGTRSAVFAPMENVGLIVMDEEQENTYKSERAPRYHARDVARARAARHKCLLLLASATPGMDSFYQAQKGAYTLVRLDRRYGTARLPDVTILDMSAQPLSEAGSSFSRELADQLSLNLEAGEQSILLLNRRGYNTLVKCAVCGEVAMCPNCSVALTYHSANGSLMCHYCGHITPADKTCPNCQSRLRRYSGTGTQRVAEELQALLPDARILRMDMDTTMARFSHERHFADFADGKYDILIGTQMVAKGLDFPNVTLVGVLNADSALYAQDYRCLERAFSLFTQVVGRGGRAKKAGRAYIQTFTPDNPVLQLAARQDYEGFYNEEIESRRLHLYPPFCRMAGVGFTGLQETLTREAAMLFLDYVKALAAGKYPDLPLRLLGPCQAQVYKAAGKYRWHMAIKCVYNGRTRSLLREAMDWYCTQKAARDVTMFIDPYYESAI